ncbi:hypothetical protein H6P81_020547 [Aristolochia fimbriata]|uniref:DYW domain-containing protein n=1 Tax=Aristolochia fimbriata TaxID=158543 RepID=A0AAV7DZ32_ARIFI|nr:hypothetical protein H6P81_020547 [Aristolochia fimbriata]
MAGLSPATPFFVAGNEMPRTVLHKFVAPGYHRKREDTLKSGSPPPWTVNSVSNSVELVKEHSNEGKMVEAYKPFDQMPNGNDTCWSSSISVPTRRGTFSEAFRLFGDMINSDLVVNENLCVNLLKASSSNLDVCVGKQLHARSIITGYVAEGRVLATLITMYSNYGLLDEAQCLFHVSLPCFNVHVWNSFISATVSNKYYEKSFTIFSDMMSTGMEGPSESTYSIMIRACALTGKLEYGKLIHGNIIKCGYIDSTITGNSLISFYAKSQNLEDAKTVFKTISQKDVVSWNAIISGHQQNGSQEDAINLFRGLLVSNLVPNRISYLCVLSAISAISDSKSGKEVHGQVIRMGIEHKTTLANSLITMYSKCREVNKSILVFENMPSRDIISWNSLLQGLAQNDQLDKCLELFKGMHLSGVEPDSHSLTIVLGAVSSYQSIRRILRKGREIHGYVVRKNIHELSVFNAILTMYSTSRKILVAEKIFNGMRKRDTYSWNSMMDGYSMNGYFHETVMIFLDMIKQGLEPDHIGFSIILAACGRLASLPLGKEFHAFVVKWDNLGSKKQSHLSITNALISMYSKCGSISDANSIFARITRRDIFSWTAMITAYAHHGMACEALQLFEEMKADAKEPNSVTFLALLTACAHAGLVEEGYHFFTSMSKDYYLKPGVEHYACMVDIYGRSGQFEKAEELVETGISVFEHEKSSWDIGHPCRKEIYEKIDELDAEFRQNGYIPKTEYVLHDVDEFEKEQILSCHSEKLALAFGLLQTSSRKGVIRVMKNLRVCGDCHDWMKFASQVMDREIVIRDSRRFHYFKQGKCSCGDYW